MRSSSQEREREAFCSVCFGHVRLCNLALCPYLGRVRHLIDLEKLSNQTDVFGASPPAVFIGSYGYPRILAGPLVPPTSQIDTAIMDQSENWLSKSFDDLLTYRFSLVRGKKPTPVQSARDPDRLLSTMQELVMASRPADTEMLLYKPPNLRVLLSARESPFGPSAPMEKATLTENPSVPRAVEKVAGDTDLRALPGVVKLYDGGVPQRQITHIFSVGLLGLQTERRLVPTEWSITAVDDILGRKLWREVLRYPLLNDYLLFQHKALANNVQILLLPTPWMFEAMEGWLRSPTGLPESDYELSRGRRDYPQNIAGGYHASRLPVLEYLQRVRRQAGAIVFLEIYEEWIPLGVWRFREISREALRKPPQRFSQVEEALAEIRKTLKWPLERWTTKSELLGFLRQQKRIDEYLGLKSKPSMN
jgi:DNA repair protein NreA